jgi:hypothetical protein
VDKRRNITEGGIRMKRYTAWAAALAVLVALGFLFTQVAVVTAAGEKAEKAKFEYVGASKCKMCHKGAKKGEIWEKWEASAHAKAFESLPEASRKDEKCLACHTTGFGEGGYAVGAETADKFAGVGCEACHGPGSAYKSMKVMKDPELAKQKGLITPDEKTCQKCHVGDKLPKECWGGKDAAPKFDFAEMYKKIEHKVPKK